MGVDAREFPGGLLRLDPAFAYAEPPSSRPLPRAECLTLAPGSDRILVELFQILTQYAICRLPASNLSSIISHIHSWVLFLLWLHPFILSGVISPLISSSILGTYRPGEFLFQYPIILPFHTVHGVLKARTLKWFAIPFLSATRENGCLRRAYK